MINIIYIGTVKLTQLKKNTKDISLINPFGRSKNINFSANVSNNNKSSLGGRPKTQTISNFSKKKSINEMGCAHFKKDQKEELLFGDPFSRVNNNINSSENILDV